MQMKLFESIRVKNHSMQVGKLRAFASHLLQLFKCRLMKPQKCVELTFFIFYYMWEILPIQNFLTATHRCSVPVMKVMSLCALGL